MHAYLAGNDSKDLKYNAICVNTWSRMNQIGSNYPLSFFWDILIQSLSSEAYSKSSHSVFSRSTYFFKDILSLEQFAS